MKILNKEKLKSTLDARFEDHLHEGRFAGAEAMVFQHGECLYHRVLGYKNALTGEKLKGDEMYRLASMTKPITAAATLIAVQRGWFALDDEVADYLPEYADMEVAVIGEDGEPVADHKARSDLKIYQMLSHCNGIMAEDEVGSALFERIPVEAYTNSRTMVDYCSKQPLAFDPGTKTAYTGFASFDVVARIIEMKSGMSFGEFLDREIFAPLGIKNITFHPTDEQWERFVTVHDRADNKTLLAYDFGRHIYEGHPLEFECAGGGIAGNMSDYAKFALMLCNNGEYNGVRILEPEMIKEMKTARVPDGIPGREPNDSWGLGVRVKVHEDWLPEGTFGWSGAYGTHFWVDQENGIVALLLRNMRFYDTHGCGQMGIQYEKDVMSCAE